MIEIRDLSFRYAHNPRGILDNINLHINDGEYIAILGRSGSGKTTLIRAICGLIPHFYEGEYRGEVIVDGKKVSETIPREIAKHVGVVFQNPENQILSLRVFDELAFALESRGCPPKEVESRVKEIAEILGIRELLDRDVNTLSGGELQLIAIGSILLSGANTIILDEPLANLDPWNVRKILEILNKLNSMGKTIIIVEHRTDLLLEFSNVRRGIVLHNGRIVSDNEIREIFYNPRLDKYVTQPTIVRIRNLLNIREKVIRFNELKKIFERAMD